MLMVDQIDVDPVEGDEFSGFCSELVIHHVDIQSGSDDPPDFGQDGHLQFRPFTFADIVDEREGPLLVLIGHGNGGYFDLDDGPIHFQIFLLHDRDCFFLFVEQTEPFPDDPTVIGMDTIDHRTTQQLLGGIRAEKAQGAPVQVDECPVGLDEDRLRRVFDQRAEFFFAFPQRLFGSRAFEDTPVDGESSKTPR